MLGLTHQQDNFPIDTKLCRKDFVSLGLIQIIAPVFFAENHSILAVSIPAYQWS
jgi:hypothetical protein